MYSLEEGLSALSAFGIVLLVNKFLLDFTIEAIAKESLKKNKQTWHLAGLFGYAISGIIFLSTSLIRIITGSEVVSLMGINRTFILFLRASLLSPLVVPQIYGFFGSIADFYLEKEGRKSLYLFFSGLIWYFLTIFLIQNPSIFYFFFFIPFIYSIFLELISFKLRK